MRIELGNELAGRWVEINANAYTIGFLEDMQANRTTIILDALARTITASNLSGGSDRNGLRTLTRAEFGALMTGVLGAPELPKSG